MATDNPSRATKGEGKSTLTLQGRRKNLSQTWKRNPPTIFLLLRPDTQDTQDPVSELF